MFVEDVRATGRAQSIPLAPSLPILGSLPFILSREGLIPGIVRVAERYRRQGAFRLMRPGGETTTFVCNAALAEGMVDDRTWEKALDPILLRARAIGGNGLFSADSDDPAWGLAHRILAPSFSGAAMGRYFPTMRAVLDELLESWSRRPDSIDVVADTTRLTLDTIARAGFDHDFGSFRDDELDPFVVSLARALDELVVGAFRPPVVRAYEVYRKWRFETDTRAMFDRVDAVIAERRSMPRERWPNDLLSRMFEDADPHSGEKLDDVNIRFQIMTFLLAGHETTSVLLAFALHYVARDARLAERMRREVDEIVGDREPSLDAVRALDLVPRVLDETLRLHPPAPFISRTPRADTLLGGRYAVRKGEPVGFLLASIQRDPAAFPDPDRFDPDRFLPDFARRRPAHAYKPFGIGRRICTGRSFALTEATLALAMVVRTFDLDDPGPLRLGPTAIPKPRRFRLSVRRRAARR